MKAKLDNACVDEIRHALLCKGFPDDDRMKHALAMVLEEMDLELDRPGQVRIQYHKTLAAPTRRSLEILIPVTFSALYHLHQIPGEDRMMARYGPREDRWLPRYQVMQWWRFHGSVPISPGRRTDAAKILTFTRELAGLIRRPDLPVIMWKASCLVQRGELQKIGFTYQEIAR